jgi:adenylate cyclase class 2
MIDQEIEVKFFVHDLNRIESLLEQLGAKLVQPRTFEINLRFDTAEHELAYHKRVLRLRQDTEARLTFKGEAEDLDGARKRQEIEFTVGDFQTAWRFLEALGYIVDMSYEKYRTVYNLEGLENTSGGLHIMLDELPYGNFLEIEGQDASSIRQVCQALGLDWKSKAMESYTAIFDLLKAARGLEFRDLSFKNFEGIQGLQPELGELPQFDFSDH